MAIYKIRQGDRDCSASIIDALKTAGLDTHGASYTGNIRACFLATGEWKWLPITTAKKRSDILLKDGSHVAMMKNATQLMQFSHNEVHGYYNGRVGDQLNGNGSGAESNICLYYNYPWNGVLRYIGKHTDKLEVATQLMEHLVTCPSHGYTMSSPGREGSGGYCEVNINVGTGTTEKVVVATPTEPIEKDTGIIFTYRVRVNGKWLPEVTNLNDYAGIRGKAITDVAIKVNKGKVWYQAHQYRGGWLKKITGYDIKDSGKYAGVGKPIDAIRIR